MAEVERDHELAAMRFDTEAHLRRGTGCPSCAKNVLALLDRLAAAEAAVDEAHTEIWAKAEAACAEQVAAVESRLRIARERRDKAEAKVARVEALLSDGPDTWTPYESRDTGWTFLQESVLDFTADLRVALTKEA